MKKIITYTILLIMIFMVFIYRKDITNYVTNNIIKQEIKEELKFNEYSKKTNYEYVQITNDLTVNKKEEIKNIFYTILDSGVKSFSFYCDSEYKECDNDIKTFFNDKDILSNINNFVHPYNSFKNIRISVTNYGKITLDISHLYNQDEITIINDQIDTFIKENINDTMTTNDKIKVFHDYIINNTKFDTAIENSLDRLNSSSYTAYGLLIDHLAICGGYTDTMAIYLNKLNIKNYRISTTEHVTWDDPFTSDGSDMLMYDYYLISTSDMLNKDTTQHNFNQDVYIEAK